MPGESLAVAIVSLGDWLTASSVALVVSGATAALWCACVQRSRARVRYAVWLTALAVAVVAPLLATARRVVFGGGVDGSDATLALPAASGPLIAAWSIGVVALLSRLVMQHVSLWRWGRGLALLDSPCSTELLEQLASRRRSARRLRVVRGDAATMPVCWGILRPRIMLPADSKGWSDELRRIVLRHEWAHIEQRDALADVLARVVVAVLWFHPAAWVINARVRIERERACDERVVDSGVDPVAYGRELLALARATRSTPAVAAAVAGRGALQERIAALLVADGRHHALDYRLALAVALSTVVLPAAILTPSLAVPRVLFVHSGAVASASQLPGGHPGSFRASLLGRAR